MCEILDVSRAGFYAWQKRGASLREQTDQALLSQIREVFQKSRKNYGSPRVYKALKQQGLRIGRKRVARLMRRNGIVAEPFRRINWKREFKTAKAADNLLQRRFAVKERFSRS